MKKISLLLIACFLNLSASYGETGNAQILDTGQIENLTGAKGEFDRNSKVFKVSVPREDLKVSSLGVKLTPALGLASWASFMPLGSEVEVMGDMVLLEDQINPVMKEALGKGLNVTALHNHYLWDNPKIMFMHLEGKGSLKDVASAIGKVFETIKKTSGGNPWALSPPPIDPSETTLAPQNIDAILGTKGTFKNGIYKLAWGRTTQVNGHDIGSLMRANTWAAFAGTEKQAVMLGDFAMTEDEVQNVLKTLLKHNIFIISLHQHMIRETPKIIYVHYMGKGPAIELAKALKETLDQIKPPLNFHKS